MSSDFYREIARSNSDFWSKLLFGIPLRSFLSHEKKIINAVIESVSLEVREKLEKQLSGRFFIDRSNPRMNVISIGQFPDSLKINDFNFEDCLFKVKLKENGKTSFANVTFYLGYLFSVETKTPRKELIDQEINVISVAAGKPKDILSDVIDRIEHG